MKRKFLMASVGVAVLTGSAIAADLPSSAPPPIYVSPVPIFTWTGVYLGGQIGYAGGGTQTANVYGPFGGFGTIGPRVNGVIGGAHVGYNQQINQFVVGLEGSVDGSSLHKTASGQVFSPLFTPVTVHGDLGIQGSIRGRLGVAFDRALVYVTGGVAVGGFSGSVSTPYGHDSLSTTRVGPTVGGGLEYALTNNWLVRVEYRHTGFGTTNSSLVNGRGLVQVRIGEDQVSGRLQL